MEISSTAIVAALTGVLMGLIGWHYGKKQKGRQESDIPLDVTPLTRSLVTSKAGADRTSALIRACDGDRKQAERLIQDEKEKMRGLSHADAVRRALERLIEARIK
ncbi:hypothetical protein SAMN04515618_101166 [Collimonas sp. OK307]|uniref:hypothetical protein n=1 Tax=Collimonas sp. OK307 TaxID=1801620 RepID=UPI0008F39CCD|nr:hypothetical protein [Collimonas sp. OK307]SFH62113.1 hypothetical protein SAMN04515618_101166 [Collimonas sp. OK307]